MSIASYKEYFIRCPSCNEQIACFSGDYLTLLDGGSSIEDALNSLGIMNPCSRIAMMNPVTVFFHVDEREVIDGTRLPSVPSEYEAPLPIRPASPRAGRSGLNSFVQMSLDAPIPIGEGVKLTIKNEGGFTVPEVVGMSNINTDVTIPDQMVAVGNGMFTRVLNGRTYLAE